MRNGILKNHLNPNYRCKDPFKALYIGTNKPSATTSFVSLLSYQQSVSIDAVLLAEAMCASLFGTFDSYRRLRTLDNCLNSGPIHVGFHPRRKHVRNGSYQSSLLNESFTLPKDMAISWKLECQAEINVQ